MLQYRHQVPQGKPQDMRGGTSGRSLWYMRQGEPPDMGQGKPKTSRQGETSRQEGNLQTRGEGGL